MALFFEILFRAVLVVLVILALTRVHGLRSFSKMSGFDFAITVAIGSVLAGAVTTLGTGVWTYIAALIALFLVQICISRLRVNFQSLQNAVDNAPVLVMQDGKILPDNLKKAGMSTSDLWAKLREANAFNLEEVRAVVMETTGDVSVLHGPKDGPSISPEVLQNL